MDKLTARETLEIEMTVGLVMHDLGIRHDRLYKNKNSYKWWHCRKLGDSSLEAGKCVYELARIVSGKLKTGFSCSACVNNHVGFITVERFEG